MSFVEAFYTFSIEIVDPDRQRYESVRVKAPKHPLEEMEAFYARIMAFALSYEEGLVFSQGLYTPQEPAAWKKDLIGNVLTWVEVGEVEVKKLRLAIRHAAHSREIKTLFRVYFFTHAQIQSFCSHLRGSKTNWIEGAEFFLLDETMLSTLALHSSIRSSWNLTISDNTIYLLYDGKELSAPLTPLNMWDEYQKHLTGISEYEIENSQSD